MINAYLTTASLPLGIDQFWLFHQKTEGGELYECLQVPTLELGIDTILNSELAPFFTPVEILGYPEKLEALADRILNGDNWTPAIGDYFTDIDNLLRLYLITQISGDTVFFITISGGAYEEEEASLATFTETRVKIEFPTDESGSGSGSGSGS